MLKTEWVRAFTIIEVLIVMSIIGILASIILGTVGTAKPKAQTAKTLASLRSAQQVAVYCVDGNNNLNFPNIANLICDGQGNWPAPVGDGWSYGDAGTCSFDGDVSDGTFMYCASNGTDVIQCSDTGCRKL